MGSYFGTDGIRGTYGKSPLDEPTIIAIGRALARFGLERGGSAPRFAVGRDTRASGPELSDLLMRGMAAEGAGTLFDFGVLPTPAIAHGGDRLGATLSIALTASHNPASDNGIKLFLPGCRKLDPATEAAIEAQIAACLADPREVEASRPKALPNPGAKTAYLDHLKGVFEGHLTAGLRIGLDMANGATTETSQHLLRDLGVKVFPIGTDPGGAGINAGCGSEHPEALAAHVREKRLDCGFAHDGDGDRLVMVDGTGKQVDGDGLLGAVALRLVEKGDMPNPVLVTTVQSNSGLDAALAAKGIRVERTPVGDRNVQERMISGGMTLGGENSGHLIYRPVLATGDGLTAICLVLKLFSKEELRRLAELAAAWVPLFPQSSAALEVPEKPPLESCAGLQQAISEVTEALGGNGRVLVRYSGTESKLRLLVEAEESVKAENLLERLVAAATSDLG